MQNTTSTENAPRRRRIAVILIDRANYGRLKPVMRAIQVAPSLMLQVICGGTMVLERFDRPVRVVEQDGFTIDGEIFVELEGSTPSTMAKSLGFAIIEFSSEFSRLKPDVVLVIGDRYEALAAALAASYMNICLAHVQGGEVSGSIDESARHAISKLAHYHFPSTARSAEYLVRMGERPETVFHVGCPSGDVAKSLTKEVTPELFAHGIGATIDCEKPYVLVIYHPVTTKYSTESNEVHELLTACEQLGVQVVWLWPNIDAGADNISRMIRRFREQTHPGWLRLMKNLPPEEYLRVLSRAACAVGNSSSFIRDSSFFGTPVVLVSDRQQGREYAENVVPVEGGMQQMLDVIRAQIKRGRYGPSTLYGDGTASRQIVQHLVSLEPYVQKRLAYIESPR